MSLPRVLIIGQPFNMNTGGGITLTNLFRGWDRDKIAVTCAAYLLLDNIDTEVCNTYYQLGYKEHKWIFPFNLFKRKYSSGLIKFDDNRFQNLKEERPAYRVSLIMNYFYPFLRFIGLFHCSSKIKLSGTFCNWLDEYKPDIIYAQTTSRADNLFCISVQSYLNKPLIYHMMDDWPSIIDENGLFKNYWFRKIDYEFRRLLEKAEILMSISDSMAREYKKRYDRDFVTFHNTIDIKFWEKHQRSSYELNETPSILYAGRIGMGIDTSLELVAQAVEKINLDMKISMRFLLQTQEKPEWSNNYKCVKHNNFVSYEDLPKVFSEADFLLLPYDFTQTSVKYIKYSMPTKAPEYMISGTPIIIFAPEETAIVEYARRHNWAEVITQNNIGTITDSIKQLIEREEFRKQISQNAIRIAQLNHNSVEVTNSFKKIVCSLAEDVMVSS